MSRSKWKGPYVHAELFLKYNKDVFTKSRSSLIVPSFIGKTFYIHNGKNFLKLLITEDMIGKKLGEFSPTRKNFTFKKKKLK